MQGTERLFVTKNAAREYPNQKTGGECTRFFFRFSIRRNQATTSTSTIFSPLLHRLIAVPKQPAFPSLTHSNPYRCTSFS
mmetsp:Transcript_47438/g.55424  ORF Transcript_47438/g.55424 Transcript_47438/m.55424 type:complete len:80 (+) Transcript_47438:121-360(+)